MTVAPYVVVSSARTDSSVEGSILTREMCRADSLPPKHNTVGANKAREQYGMYFTSL